MKNKASKGKTPKKRGVSKATKKEPKFPGYPKYPASEDIMNTDKRVLIRDESTPLELQNGLEDEGKNTDVSPPRKPDPLDLEKDKESELTERVEPVDFTGEDLDVPGTELDDESEKTGNEDEENNLYSLGNSD